MKTKYNRLVINLTEDGHERVQRLLFRHGFGWGKERKSEIAFRNLPEPRCQVFKSFEKNPNKDDAIYNGETRYDCLFKEDYNTLYVKDTELDKILDWLNSEYEEEIIVKPGQRYSIMDGSLMDGRVCTLIKYKYSYKNEYRWLEEDYSYDNKQFSEKSLIEGIKYGNCKLIE